MHNTQDIIINWGHDYVAFENILSIRDKCTNAKLQNMKLGFLDVSTIDEER
jgi:hypothetical protein